MATKKKTVRNTKQTVDQGYIEEAYKDAVKNLFATFITNCITEDAEAEKRFTKGLNIIRKARERTLELVN
jgi:hypothetical protein